MKTEADFDAAFQGQPMRVNWKDLFALYGDDELNVLDAIIREQLPVKYRNAVWENVVTHKVLIRAICLGIQILEGKK